MPQTLRIATFNCENLFRRFRFKNHNSAEAERAIREGFILDRRLLKPHMPKARKITARAVKAVKADVLALQEVENLDALRLFNTRFLNSRYKYQLVIDGNDPRAIDVGVLSRYPFGRIRTHQFDKKSPRARSKIFSRDCLEVEILLSGKKTLTLFVNHFKSMMGGRSQTMARRREQTTRVARIIAERYGSNPAKAKFVILGDFNDYYEGANLTQASRGLSPLLGKAWLVDANLRIKKPQNRWTHFWAKKKKYRQLDYILLSKSLARANPTAVPKIERRGMPKRATKVTRKRFPGVGNNTPKASDHCPVVIALKV
jgi:endonuclease/exonuclease/phosphatase family metal-dependent hydrolase